PQGEQPFREDKLLIRIRRPSRTEPQLGQGGPHRGVDLTRGQPGHQSGIPSTLYRPGVVFPSKPWSNAPSVVTSTRSPRRAPSRSNARTGSPSAFPSTPSSWTTSIGSPWNVGCLTVAVAVPSTRPTCMKPPSNVPQTAHDGRPAPA